MKVFTVFSKGSIQDYYNEVIYIEEGFSFWATFLGALWTIYHRLWFQTGVILGFYFLLSFFLVTEKISDEIFISAFVSFSLYIGLTAREWYEKSLMASGYQLKDIIIAKDLDEAQYKFISRDVMVQS